MAAAKKKPLMRNIGEFFGHIIKGVKTDPSKESSTRQEISRKVEEEDQGDMILRRTTIEEVEFKKPQSPDQAHDQDPSS